MSAEAQLDGLRSYLAEHPNEDDPVRFEAYLMALSSTLRRMMVFEQKEGFVRDLSSRDVLELLKLTEGDNAETIARIGYGRALTERNLEFVQLFQRFGLAEDFRAWTMDFMQGSMQEMLDKVAAISDPEELAFAHMLIARQYPEALQRSWILEALNNELATGMAADMALTIAERRVDLHDFLIDLLQARPEVLFTYCQIASSASWFSTARASRKTCSSPSNLPTVKKP